MSSPLILKGVTAVVCAALAKNADDNRVVVQGSTLNVLMLMSLLANAVVKSLVDSKEMSHKEAVKAVTEHFFFSIDVGYEKINEVLIEVQKQQEVQ